MYIGACFTLKVLNLHFLFARRRTSKQLHFHLKTPFLKADKFPCSQNEKSHNLFWTQNQYI